MKRPTQKQLLAFVAQVASATKDGECAVCYSSESENAECPDHELLEMPNDDAVETLHYFIDMARELCPVAGLVRNEDGTAVDQGAAAFVERATGERFRRS